jgi:hypothetical protein
MNNDAIYKGGVFPRRFVALMQEAVINPEWHLDGDALHDSSR